MDISKNELQVEGPNDIRFVLNMESWIQTFFRYGEINRNKMGSRAVNADALRKTLAFP